jgi:hypothetical protein
MYFNIGGNARYQIIGQPGSPENFIPGFPSLLQSLSPQPVSPDLDTALRRRFPAGFSRYLDGADSERGRVFSPKRRSVSEP